MFNKQTTIKVNLDVLHALVLAQNLCHYFSTNSSTLSSAGVVDRGWYVTERGVRGSLNVRASNSVVPAS